MKCLLPLEKAHLSSKISMLAFLGCGLALVIAFYFFIPYQKFSKFLGKHNLVFTWTAPNTEWETATPESLGIDGFRIDILRDQLTASKTRALLIARHNKIILEWYAPGQGPNTLYGTASFAKALCGSISLLLAISDGRVGIDEPAWKYIPAWKDHPIKSKITIRHLATHTSGIEDANEPGKPKRELAGWKKAYWQNHSERFSVALTKAPVIFPPGSRYAYSNPGAVALGYAISSSLKHAHSLIFAHCSSCVS